MYPPATAGYIDIKLCVEHRALFVGLWDLPFNHGSRKICRGGAGETYARLQKIPNTSDGQLQQRNNFHRVTSSRVSTLHPFQFEYIGTKSVCVKGEVAMTIPHTMDSGYLKMFHSLRWIYF
ncbi:hypothetical protein B0H14DRAFT_2646828 [Mycena olivaceomarginata]|nr:hypothetical protein B0H14DRAFT_2646828 [Mycena olivaceomarginata]